MMRLRRKRQGHGVPSGIVLHSRGGIGNQLFCTLAALSLADKRRCGLWIDPSQHRFTPHLPFLINQLIAKAPKGLSSSISCLPEPAGQIRRTLLKVEIPKKCSFAESSFRYSQTLYSVPIGSCIIGYFQSWRYLANVSETRKTEFGLALARMAINPQTFDKRDIVIHVRRGDYTHPGVREIHGVLPYQYYSRAITHLRETGQSGTVWAISENKLTDLNELEQLIGTRVVQLAATSLWTDLQTLTAAPALVIANSTFSWMAGWFNPHQQNVVAPSPWFLTNEYDTSDLIPPHWHTVKHGF
jgi:Glycosyl transferase family 11